MESKDTVYSAQPNKAHNQFRRFQITFTGYTHFLPSPEQTIMLGLRASPLLSTRFSSTFSPSKHLKSTVRFSTKSPITMPIIEHIVLFKVKEETEPSKVNAMLNGLNALVNLDPVLHLSAGPLFRTRSSLSNFTHILHSRYKSKEDLTSYAVHPDHQTVVKENVLPICDDLMAVDWISDCDVDPLVPPSGSAVKVTFLKLKENAADEAKGEILGVIKGIRNGVSGIQQITCGENFSARAKGFSIASIAVFPGVEELEAADSNAEFLSLQKEKVRDHLDGVVVVDYVIPSSSSSSSL